MELAFFWLFTAVIVAILASKRQRSGLAYFLLAVVFSPLLIGILVLVMGNARPTPMQVSVVPTDLANNDAQTRCPECRELVRVDARKCKHCGTSLVAIAPSVIEKSPATLPRNW